MGENESLETAGNRESSRRWLEQPFLATEPFEAGSVSPSELSSLCMTVDDDK